MAKKNSKVSTKKRMSVIKNEYMISSKKKEFRRELKGLQKQVKSQPQVNDIDMDNKVKHTGINFSRSVDSTRPLRARDKKIIQRALKRKRKLNT
ncbi:conserved hypothetical protein [Theileria orientalis strain Shintoku]|uniref:Uncharacterized protein n=1 Tax=Theileria orientalis strain Shintoku TaxID=869250 RepID=J4C8Y5_THEOR|nr:conserved hypothetical protein [Theileria orientalis strain Shintoku]BAM41598.1 conserved hypothetical protein [Theileria orientalis strain Shintoku]|eukprot:XP_009691899.1 conserved hypothetical protein [Theileria orientalis strain Shintoku]